MTITTEVMQDLSEDGSVSIEMNIADLSDVDLGIQLLSDAIFAHSSQENNYDTIAQDLLAQTELNERALVDLKKSEKRWNKWKWGMAVLTVVTLAVTFFADSFDQLIDTDKGRQRTVRIVLILAGGALAIISAIFGFIAQRIEGNKNSRYKRKVGLQQNETDMVKKMRVILENWGALRRAREDYRSEVDVNKSVKECFKNIKQLPDTISDKQLPPKSTLASMTLQLLDDEHPTKKIANKIKTVEESISPPNSPVENGKSFKDLGQKGTLQFDSGTLPNCTSEELEVTDLWRQLQKQMGGLYIDELFCDGACIARRDAKPIVYSDTIDV